ncbi:HAD family hydrolase [Actinomadura hibisca]|uniref:HAD family hydrolase n=1 Tax=Actinomadura hibisca TaxID=68565 RepID=UPI00082FBC45|nr:HAD family hydrolase [Actinomadura hibisca]
MNARATGDSIAAQLAGVRGVCFDLGGTLVPLDGGEATTATLAEALGLTLEDARAWTMSAPKRRRVHPRELAAQICAAHHQPQAIAEVEQILTRAQQYACDPALFGDVEPTLRLLRARGYRLLALSNALGSSAPDRPPPFYRLLDAVLVSYDIGYCKPEPQAFAALQQASGLPGPALLHVGDSVHADADGARAAGLHALLLTRPLVPPRTGIGVPQIRALTDLLPLLPALT